MLPAKILICGLPGSGKTTLARALDTALWAAGVKSNVVDGDAVRMVTGDADFSTEGRLRQAKRMGMVADELNKMGLTACCSFVCPTKETREAFWWSSTSVDPTVRMMTVFVDRIVAGPYADTNQIFEVPLIEPFGHVVLPEETVAQSVAAILTKLGAHTFDREKPTALLVGRFQPFHDGHKALVAKAIADVGQCVVGVRHIEKDENNPLSMIDRMERVITALDPDFCGRYEVFPLPNIVKIIYGRTPGYHIEQYTLDADLEAISGAQLREQGL